MRLPIASHRDRSVDGTGQAHANRLWKRVRSCGAPGRRRHHLPRRWPHGFPARGLPQWDALAPNGLHEGVEGREVADYDVRRHGEDLRQAAALRPPPRERGAQTRERRETQAPATPRSAAPETRQGGEGKQAEVRDEPAADLVADQDPRERPVAERVQEAALEVERVPAASDGADLAAVLPLQRPHTGGEADGLADRERPPNLV